MKTNPNEPINPIPNNIIELDGIDPRFANGLTKREYFAAMAMQSGILQSNINYFKNGNIRPVFIAIDAVAIADALIKELNHE